MRYTPQLCARTWLFLLALLSAPHAMAQVKPQPRATPPGCDQTRAMLLVQQQITEARSFESVVAQVSVLTRAADLLWPYQQDAARAAFNEAYELAAKDYQQRGDEIRQAEMQGRIARAPDQRFKVVAAIARRDAIWARRLAKQAAEETQGATDPGSAMDAALGSAGEKLIGVAISLLPTDKVGAIALARGSFRYPATISLPRFFFKLAEADQAAADQLVRDAIAAYAAHATTSDLSYLSVYPFALPRPVSLVGAWTTYAMPPNFAPNPELRELYLNALLAHAELILKTPEQFNSNARASRRETTQAYVALTTLAPLTARFLPAYLERVTALKAALEATLDEKARQSAAGYFEAENQTEKFNNFELLVAEAEHEGNAERKDGAIARTVLAAKTLEQLDRVEKLAQQMSDMNARQQLLDWINFNRAQSLLKNGLLDEAKRAAVQVSALDIRAILFLEIAREAIKRLADKVRARELLDEVVAAAAKAPETAVKARTLLGVAHLFAEFDGLRAIEVTSDAVKTINTLTDPDLSRTFLTRSIEGKGFGVFTGLNVPGFNLENVFHELGPLDFEGALLIARKLDDKTMRATAILGLSAQCLEQVARPAPPKQQPSKKATSTTP